MTKREPFFTQGEHFDRSEEPKPRGEEETPDIAEKEPLLESPDGPTPWEQENK